MAVVCSFCGSTSDRGIIQRCRECTPVHPCKWLHRGSNGPVIVAVQKDDSDMPIFSLLDLHNTKRAIRKWQNGDPE